MDTSQEKYPTINVSEFLQFIGIMVLSVAILLVSRMEMIPSFHAGRKRYLYGPEANWGEAPNLNSPINLTSRSSWTPKRSSTLASMS